MNRDIQARTYEIFRYELEATSSPVCFFYLLNAFFMYSANHSFAQTASTLLTETGPFNQRFLTRMS